MFGDMLVFAVFFATFMVEGSKAPELFDAARATLHIGVGLTNTLVLVHQFAVCCGGDRSQQIRGEIDCHRGDYGGDRVRPSRFIGLKVLESPRCLSTEMAR